MFYRVKPSKSISIFVYIMYWVIRVRIYKWILFIFEPKYIFGCLQLESKRVLSGFGFQETTQVLTYLFDVCVDVVGRYLSSFEDYVCCRFPTWSCVDGSLSLVQIFRSTTY